MQKKTHIFPEFFKKALKKYEKRGIPLENTLSLTKNLKISFFIRLFSCCFQSF